VKAVAVVPVVGEALPSDRTDAARTGMAVANESATSATAAPPSARRARSAAAQVAGPVMSVRWGTG
jgi:hypothetical protein